MTGSLYVNIDTHQQLHGWMDAAVLACMYWCVVHGKLYIHLACNNGYRFLPATDK
jgi:hypothetical protein